MVLIYSHTTSPRLQYTCNFIFAALLGVDFSITIDSEAFKNHEGVSINYSDLAIKQDGFKINPISLLFEEHIQLHAIDCFEVNGNKAFFKIADSDIPFDIFAATFFLLSRYEEYLPHTLDMYGRFAHENSLAFKEGFLQLPLVNIWIKNFATKLTARFPSFTFRLSPFSFLPTYDIDIAYSYRHKGLLRNIGGFIKSPSIERMKVLLGLQKDPFDAYGWLNALHQKNKLEAIYFFLLAEKNGQYDKNILPHKDIMWKLVQHHAKKYTVGIHPSWQSGDTPALLRKEKDYLAEMIEKDVDVSRQHYIRFHLPTGGYQHVMEAGISHDYSMGYGSINGFRASVASSFFWYDLKNEKQTGLLVHPFCFMDANSYYEQKFSAAQAYEELLQYYKICKEVNGTLITIWHNNFVGTDKKLAGWREMYEQFVGEVAAEARRTQGRR
jgi:hypothetical protein